MNSSLRFITLTSCFALTSLSVSVHLFAQDIEVRSLNGLGNNLDNPTWGVSSLQFLFSPSPSTPFSAYSRLEYEGDYDGNNDYADGIGSPARPLAPNPRLISNVLSRQDGSNPEPTGLNDIAAWWLFCLHTDMAVGLQNSPATGGPGDPSPILVPSGDPIFDAEETGEATIVFNRAFSTQTFGIPGTREIINFPTAFLDLDVLYQRNPADNAAVRMGIAGRMLLQPSASGEMVTPTAGFVRATSGNPTALIAVPDHIAITGSFPAGIALHTLLLREHNRVAAKLHELPIWLKWLFDLPIEFWLGPAEYDEAMFQLARSIVEAEMQAITYREVLPTLGVDLGPYQGYQANSFPGVNIEFVTGPFRLENMASLFAPRIDRSGQPLPEGPVNTALTFIPPFSYSVFLEQGTDPILRGMLLNPAQRNGLKFEEGLRSIQPAIDLGLTGALNDLMAAHIQRGRDRGIPPFAAVRLALGLPPVTSFADMTSDPAVQQDLELLYGSVDEVDAIVGIQAEDRAAGSIFGATALRLYERQFELTRATDRFWHERLMSQRLRLPIAMLLSGLNIDIEKGRLVLDRTVAGLILDSSDVGRRGDDVRLRRRSKALIVK